MAKIYIKEKTATFFRNNYPYYIIIAILLTVYLPMLSGIMSIKNDSLTVSYPVFYYFSNQLSQGNIPWWHFNIHMGFPLHSDPGTPFWNPIYWLFALTGKGIFVFMLMIWVHVAIGAIGVYRLCKWFNLSNSTSIVSGVCYACSGYYVAHLQHSNNLFEAAFLPFVLLLFLRTLYNTSLKNAVYLSVSLFFLVNSGYPAFPVAMLYFLAAMFISYFLSNKSDFQKVKISFSYILLSLSLAVVLSLPYLVSLSEVIGNFHRAMPSSVNKDFFENGGMTFPSLLSMIWPFATVSHPEFFKTDIAWSNIYTGIIFLSFVIFSVLYDDLKLKYTLLFAGLFLLLLSFQGSLKLLLFNNLPFLSIFRSNGGFRIFFILSIIVIGGAGLEKAFSCEYKTRLKVITRLLIVTLTIVIAGSAFLSFNSNHLSIGKGPGIIAYLKNIPVSTAILIQSLIGLVLLVLADRFIGRKKIILFLILVDISLSFWLCLPYTGLSLINLKEVNTSVQNSIEMINHAPENALINEAGNSSFKTKFIAEPALYSKNIGVLGSAGYPSALHSYIETSKNYDASFYSSPGIYLKAAYSGKSISNVSVNSESISFEVNTPVNDSVIVLQNSHPDWKCFIDGERSPVHVSQGTFMAIPVNSGHHGVALKYVPYKVVVSFWISVLGWITAFIIMFTGKKRNV